MGPKPQLQEKFVLDPQARRPLLTPLHHHPLPTSGCPSAAYLPFSHAARSSSRSSPRTTASRSSCCRACTSSTCASPPRSGRRRRSRRSCTRCARPTRRRTWSPPATRRGRSSSPCRPVDRHHHPAPKSAAYHPAVAAASVRAASPHLAPPHLCRRVRRPLHRGRAGWKTPWAASPGLRPISPPAGSGCFHTPQTAASETPTNSARSSCPATNRRRTQRRGRSGRPGTSREIAG